ncbi:MAG: hypothetical protein PHU51_05855 [Candidatus Nanoarchaeia archaeon]|nr:hypothetical protein [Candidatus Nanoarchaeia archaeon]MDD4205818.1 hypothetical protein [Candidatus Delongbacteria bacterium]
MKEYIKIFRFNYRTMPLGMLIYLTIVIFTILMKVFDSEAYILFGKVDSVFVLVFVNLFGIACILNYIILILCLKLSLNTPIFHSVPEIRNKIMNYSLLHLSFYFAWFVFIAGGLKELKLISFLVFLNLCILSLIVTAFFFDSVSVYRSRKYIIVKILFHIFGLIGIFALPAIQDKYPRSATLFYAGFAAVIIYQAVSFRRNYINFNLKESSENGFENTIRSIEKYFESMPEKSLRKRITHSEKSSDKYRELFEITIFGVYHPLIYLQYPWIAAIVFGLIIDHEGMIPFLSVIPLIAGSYLSLTIGNKDKITFLYTTSGLSRKEFVNKVLKTVLRKFLIAFLPLLPFMILYTIIYNKFTGVMEYHVPVILFVFILAAWLFLTWIVWMAVLQFADFDKLKSINSESLFSRMRFRK